MKKLLVLCLPLVLTASIIAGPIETFNIEVSKITKDMTDTKISPQMAAGKIYDAREKLFVVGGSALRASAGLKARIEQIKATNKDFATEWNAIEVMQKKETAEKRASHKKLEEIAKDSKQIQKELAEAKLAKDAAAAEAKRLATDIAKLRDSGRPAEDSELKALIDAERKEREAKIELEKYLNELQEKARQAELLRNPVPIDRPDLGIMTEVYAKGLVEKAYTDVRQLLPTTRAKGLTTFLTSYIEPKVIKAHKYEIVIKPALAKFKKSIEDYESTAGSVTETILKMKKDYNFYPLEINRQMLFDKSFKQTRKQNADKLITIVNNNIDTLFTYPDGSVIEGNGSQFELMTNKTKAFGYFINKTKDELKVDAEKTLGLADEFVDAKEAPAATNVITFSETNPLTLIATIRNEADAIKAVAELKELKEKIKRMYKKDVYFESQGFEGLYKKILSNITNLSIKAGIQAQITAFEIQRLEDKLAAADQIERAGIQARIDDLLAQK